MCAHAHVRSPRLQSSASVMVPMGPTGIGMLGSPSCGSLAAGASTVDFARSSLQVCPCWHSSRCACCGLCTLGAIRRVWCAPLFGPSGRHQGAFCSCVLRVSLSIPVMQSTGTALRDLESPLGAPALKLDLSLDGASCAELLAERDASFSASGDSMHSDFTGVRNLGCVCLQLAAHCQGLHDPIMLPA